jgi:SAM-dependent methyltransferase
MSGYLLAGQDSEVERLRVQSEVWEPAGRNLLAQLGPGTGRRAIDLGCGPLGWLRILDEAGWETTGTDVQPAMLAAAAELGLPAQLVEDDVFASALPPARFDLVHARFLLAPLGRWDEQLASYVRLLAPGGVLVLEEPDAGSWRFNPPAPAGSQLIAHVLDAFRAGGGEFEAGRALPSILRDFGIEPTLTAEVVALPHGHPYLRLPLAFATSLRPRLVDALGEDALDALLAETVAELADPWRWGLSHTLVQAWARL